MSRRSGTFGLTSSGWGRGGFRGGLRGSTHFRGGRGRGRGRGRGGASANTTTSLPTKDEEGTQLAERFEQVRLNDEVDEKLGFVKIQEGPRKEGWLINMHPVSWNRAVDVQRLTLPHRPYCETQITLQAVLLSTITSLKMMEVFSRRLWNTSRIFAYRAR